jgi:polyphosphate kinase
MPRNLDRRVELMFPVEDKTLKQNLISLLKLQWRDNQQAKRLLPDGRYEPTYKEGEERVSSQDELMKGAIT